jgi:LysM repeat protein
MGLVIAAILLTLASCQLLDEVVPTVIPPAAGDQPVESENGDDESPRIRGAQDVPPTWTPPPLSQSETPIAPFTTTQELGSQGSYTVEPGDTLAGIAIRHNITLEALALANDIQDYDHIEVGQVLVIPGF